MFQSTIITILVLSLTACASGSFDRVLSDFYEENGLVESDKSDYRQSYAVSSLKLPSGMQTDEISHQFVVPGASKQNVKKVKEAVAKTTAAPPGSLIALKEEHRLTYEARRRTAEEALGLRLALDRAGNWTLYYKKSIDEAWLNVKVALKAGGISVNRANKKKHYFTILHSDTKINSSADRLSLYRIQLAPFEDRTQIHVYNSRSLSASLVVTRGILRTLHEQLKLKAEVKDGKNDKKA